jgi:hypothetical protein
MTEVLHSTHLDSHQIGAMSWILCTELEAQSDPFINICKFRITPPPEQV